jgi:hypothetical protein
LRAAQHRFGLKQSVPRAELRLLNCKPKARPIRKRAPHFIRLMPDDDGHGRGSQRVRKPKHVFDQRQA